MIFPVISLEHEKQERAFNLGADARLAGLSLKHNPYPKYEEPNLWRSWAYGWSEVNASYGIHVKGRWKFRPLPRLARDDHVLDSDLFSTRRWLGSQRSEDGPGDEEACGYGTGSGE